MLSRPRSEYGYFSFNRRILYFNILLTIMWQKYQSVAKYGKNMGKMAPFLRKILLQYMMVTSNCSTETCIKDITMAYPWKFRWRSGLQIHNEWKVCAHMEEHFQRSQKKNSKNRNLTHNMHLNWKFSHNRNLKYCCGSEVEK